MLPCIVFSIFSRSYILDLRPGNSFVEQLLAAGFDVYLLDWGVPDERDAANRLEDYVDDYLPVAVERVREAVAILDSMLRNEYTTFSGDYYTINEAPVRPMPLQRPRPPLTIGAKKSRMLRMWSLRLIAPLMAWLSPFC